MRTRTKNFFKVALLSALAMNAPAAMASVRLALGGVTGVTGARTTGTGQATGVNADRRMGFGAGALAEFPLNKFLGIETGVFYMHRRFDLGTDTVSLARTVPTLIVPVEARFWLGNVFSVSAGPFVAFSVGDQDDSVTTGPATATFSSGNRDAVELGATAAATVNLATINKTGIFLEGRYNRGLSNSSRDGIFEERIDDMLVLAGLRYEFGLADTLNTERVKSENARLD